MVRSSRVLLIVHVVWQVGWQSRIHDTVKNLRNTTEQLAKATTFLLLRYTTNAKPTFRFEYVHAYCQLADQPGKHFCDEILTCNDACIYLTHKQGEHNLLVKLGYILLSPLETQILEVFRMNINVVVARLQVKIK